MGLHEIEIAERKDPDYFRGGVPKHIGALKPSACDNRPYGSDDPMAAGIDEHLRAAYAMIAQLRDRVEVLERERIINMLRSKQ